MCVSVGVFVFSVVIQQSSTSVDLPQSQYDGCVSSESSIQNDESVNSVVIEGIIVLLHRILIMAAPVVHPHMFSVLYASYSIVDHIQKMTHTLCVCADSESSFGDVPATPTSAHHHAHQHHQSPTHHSPVTFSAHPEMTTFFEQPTFSELPSFISLPATTPSPISLIHPIVTPLSVVAPVTPEIAEEPKKNKEKTVRKIDF